MFSVQRIVQVAFAFTLILNAFLSNLGQPKSTPATGSPQGEELLGIRLGGTPQCGAVEVLGVPFKGARLYGRTSDVSRLLVDVASSKSLLAKCVPDCNCLLEGPNCLMSKDLMVPTTGTDVPPPPPPGTVAVIFDDGGPPRNGKGPDGADPLIRLYDNARKNRQCTTELCANSAGELSVSAKCGDVKLKVSSSGKVSASVTSGNLTMTVP